MSDHESLGVQSEDDWWDQRGEAFAAWADRLTAADLEPADTTALHMIAKLADLRGEVEAAILEAVRTARRERRTWAEISTMLGVTKQAAQDKFAPSLEYSEPATLRELRRRGDPARA